MNQKKIILTTGMALFAMFFGAGNLIFPLYIGANAGQHIVINMIGFLIAGVGVPILGLLATSMFQGDYWSFFNRLGKAPACLIIAFLVVIIGPLGAMPRVETLVFNTLEPNLPVFLQNNAIFSLFFCVLVVALTYKETKVVNILGFILSPIKIIVFSILVIIGLISKEQILTNPLTTVKAFQYSLVQGYNTMDLLASFFFCAVAFKAIEQYHKEQSEYPTINSTSMAVNSSLLGAALISIAYIGFMVVAYNHASSLQGVSPEHIIKAISCLLLGKFGGLFVCVTVSCACLATVLALAEVSSSYLHEMVLNRWFSKIQCLFMVMFVTYCMSNLGFKVIMHYMTPILEIIYPATITLSIMNILYKWKQIQMVKIPVFVTAIFFLIIKIYSNI